MAIRLTPNDRFRVGGEHWADGQGRATWLGGSRLLDKDALTPQPSQPVRKQLEGLASLEFGRNKVYAKS